MNGAPTRQLSLLDSTCIIVGIIVGAGIYETPPTVAGCMASPVGTLGIWLIGGLFALSGALCYAELASAYPREGGDYVYLGRAYGRPAGFLFSWAQMAIVRPGDIALMAFIFGKYATAMWAPFGAASRVVYPVGAIAVFTLINVLGVKQGKWTQNLLVVIKAAGLLAILAVGLLAPASKAPLGQLAAPELGGFKLALILVLFTFGGWHEMAYVAAEVKRPEKNILRALLLGTLAVTAIYVLVNAAYLRTLGYKGMTGSNAVAVDTVAALLPDIAGRAIAILVCLSVLGALNGLTFTGARITYAMGAEYRAFRGLGTWSRRFGTPVWALLLQGVIASAIVLLAGSFIDTLIYTAPVFWLFFLGTAVSVFILRVRRSDRAIPRPYKVSGFPLTPVIFAGSCVFMLYSSITYALATRPKSLILVYGVLAAGVVAYGLARALRPPQSPLPPPGETT